MKEKGLGKKLFRMQFMDLFWVYLWHFYSHLLLLDTWFGLLLAMVSKKISLKTFIKFIFGIIALKFYISEINIRKKFRQKWDSNPRPHSRTRMLCLEKGLSLESGALDRSAILTCYEINSPKFIQFQDL